jgi:hypothetical protein
MVYGPNRIYAKGHYKARFFLRSKDAGNCTKKNAVALLSVTDGQDITIYAKQKVAACALNEKSFSGVDVDFELSRNGELSFHVLFTDKVSLQLDKIEIVKQ